MDPITLLALGYSLTTVASIIALHEGRSITPFVSEWETPPPVYLARSLATANPELQKAAADAIDLLEPTGLRFGPLSFRELADGERIVGAITITPATVADMADAEALATADWTTQFEETDPGNDGHDDDYPETSAAKILGPLVGGHIRDANIGLHLDRLLGVELDRVIAHELVHASGGLHSETALFGRSRKDGHARLGVVAHKTGDLMNPRYARGGRDVSSITRTLKHELPEAFRAIRERKPLRA